MPELIIHLGLPKTATTSLQDQIFPKLTQENIAYLGKSASMFDTSEPLSHIRKYIHQETDNLETSKKNLHDSLRNYRGVKKFIISDEMLLVDTKSCTWQKKLSRLSDLTSDYKKTIVVMTRDPSEACYSLFVELFNTLESKNYESFFESNQGKIFRYDTLRKLLFNLFPYSNFLYYDFKDILSNKGLNKLLFDIGGNNANELSLENSNSKAKTHLGYLTTGASLKSILYKSNTIRHLKKYIPESIARRIVFYSQKIKLTSGKEIPYPPADIYIKQKQSLEQENKQFYKITGINYAEEESNS